MAIVLNSYCILMWKTLHIYSFGILVLNIWGLYFTMIMGVNSFCSLVSKTLYVYSYQILVLNISCLYFTMAIALNSYCILLWKTLHVDSFRILVLNIWGRILVLNTHIEYFMSVFHHGYCSELVLYSPVEDFARTHFAYSSWIFEVCISTWLWLYTHFVVSGGRLCRYTLLKDSYWIFHVCISPWLLL